MIFELRYQETPGKPPKEWDWRDILRAAELSEVLRWVVVREYDRPFITEETYPGMQKTEHRVDLIGYGTTAQAALARAKQWIAEHNVQALILGAERVSELRTAAVRQASEQGPAPAKEAESTHEKLTEILMRRK